MSEQLSPEQQIRFTEAAERGIIARRSQEGLPPLCPKHVTTIGRWRVAWRFGRHRFGVHKAGPSWTAGTTGLGFIWVNWVRRSHR